jgi:hypothetical protein
LKPQFADLITWAKLGSAKQKKLNMLFPVIHDSYVLVFLACPCRACGGLFIQLGSLDDQANREFKHNIVLQGFQYEVCNTVSEAKAVITAYLVV